MQNGRLREIAPLEGIATPSDLSTTVIAPLSYLFFLNEIDDEFLDKEFCRDTKYSIRQELLLMHENRIAKEALLDPVIDDDEIDYSKEDIPWESKTVEDEKPFQFAEYADPLHVKGVKALLARYDEQFQPTLNKNPAVLEPMVLKVHDEK